jgi:hypothetical protein
MKRSSVWLALSLAACLVAAPIVAQKSVPSDGVGSGMGDLSRLSHAKSRSISPENLTGEKGKGGMATEGTGAKAARDLGQGWKISPSVRIKPGETFELGTIRLTTSWGRFRRTPRTSTRSSDGRTRCPTRPTTRFWTA